MRSSFVLILALYVFAAKAKTDKQLKDDFTSLIWSCTIDHPVSFWDLLDLNDHRVPTARKPKCLLACVYRKNSMLTSSGMVDISQMYAEAEANMNGSLERLQNGKTLADICVQVNDIAVTDGNDGCDRATLLFACVVENAPKLGFKL